jgi:predicted alpha/beta superfamily hydrolase
MNILLSLMNLAYVPSGFSAYLLKSPTNLLGKQAFMETTLSLRTLNSSYVLSVFSLSMQYLSCS